LIADPLLVPDAAIAVVAWPAEARLASIAAASIDDDVPRDASGKLLAFSVFAPSTDGDWLLGPCSFVLDGVELPGTPDSVLTPAGEALVPMAALVSSRISAKGPSAGDGPLLPGRNTGRVEEDWEVVGVTVTQGREASVMPGEERREFKEFGAWSR
jgi:hypothetical protein